MRLNNGGDMRNDYTSNYLMHHGILGMKWGVRNYQNPDGSLTPAGRERYGVGPGKDVGDISTEKGKKRRVKDLKKAIKLNEKKRAKEYTKIANNPENFLGLNKKHAKKIDEYSENIKKGEDEIARLFKKAEENGLEKIDDTKAKYTQAKLREGKNIINKMAGDGYLDDAGRNNRKIIDKYSKKYDGKKLTDDDLVEGYRNNQRKIINNAEVSANKKQIANEVASEMVKDLKRWESEGSSKLPSSFRGMSDSEIRKVLSDKVEKQVANYHKDTMFEFNNGTFDFVIDGIDEYSEAAPLTIEYDPKKKKVVNFYYT